MGDQQRSSSTTNQGEGDKASDRVYREGAAKHAQSHDTAREGHDAEEALEGEDGEELTEAEREGKSHARGPASR
jgi:hypothetical protein